MRSQQLSSVRHDWCWKWSCSFFSQTIQGKKGSGDGAGDAEQRKFDGTGYDSDLVESLERDIVSRNPNVHWYDKETRTTGCRMSGLVS